MYLSIYLSIYLSLSLFHLSLCLASKRGRRPPVLTLFDFRMCFAPQRRALFRHLDFQKWSGPGVFCTFWLGNGPRPPSFLHFWLGNVLRATTACTFSTSQLPKVVRDRQFFTLLTWKCASRHNGRALFRHLDFQKWSETASFLHFWLGMCFAPQRRALFRHLNFKSGPNLVCFGHFDLEMCFAPQRRAIFHLSSGQLAPHPPL